MPCPSTALLLPPWAHLHLALPALTRGTGAAGEGQGQGMLCNWKRILMQTSSFSAKMVWVYLVNKSRRRRWHPAPVLLPRKSHGWRGRVGCSPWGREQSDTTERLHFHFSLLCIGEGNGNPLQCSCLENPRDWGAWWAAISGVAQSRTRLKRLSSSSSSSSKQIKEWG